MKPSTNLITYRANFGAISYLPNIAKPDEYEISLLAGICKPSEDFVIVRDRLGNIVSKYGDDKWDLNPYRLAGDARTTVIHFNKLPQSTVTDSKWLVFILLYMADSGRATWLSVSSIRSYFELIRQLAIFSSKNNIRIFNIFGNLGLFNKFLKNINVKAKIVNFRTLTMYLKVIGQKRTGFTVLTGSNFKEIDRKLGHFNRSKQHPVIPPRIFSNLVNQLNEHIDFVYDHIQNISNFIIEAFNNPRFARSGKTQINYVFREEERLSFFKDAAKEYGLNILFTRFSIINLRNLKAFISSIKHACRLIIYIYSGMRTCEALSLKVGCLNEEITSNGIAYRIQGETSKLVGQNKSVHWVTSKDVKKAIELLEILAKIIGNNIGLKGEETPLFISFANTKDNRKIKPKSMALNVDMVATKKREFFKYLDFTQFVITKEDMQHLEKIDPFREWCSEKAFQIGAEWRFTNHQYRRSLAYYVSQSALVSLPSLKRQLKHISREMTVYYCQAKEQDSIFSDNEHFSRFINRTKPEADAIAYLYDVILSEESLYGAHGRFVEKQVKPENNIKLLTDQREVLERKFRNGEIAYKETPLGACTTIEPCNKKAAREIAACISCEKAVIKLSKLDKVIARQAMLVEEFKELDESSIEYRSEVAELAALEQFKNRVSTKEIS